MRPHFVHKKLVPLGDSASLPSLQKGQNPGSVGRSFPVCFCGALFVAIVAPFNLAPVPAQRCFLECPPLAPVIESSQLCAAFSRICHYSF
jgi:hypothetical protein